MPRRDIWGSTRAGQKVEGAGGRLAKALIARGASPANSQSKRL